MEIVNQKLTRNGDTAYQNLWDATKVVLGGKRAVRRTSRGKAIAWAGVRAFIQEELYAVVDKGSGCSWDIHILLPTLLFVGHISILNSRVSPCSLYKGFTCANHRSTSRITFFFKSIPKDFLKLIWEREKHWCERDIPIRCLLCVPWLGNPQPKCVPWPGIELVTFGAWDYHTNWATQPGPESL